MGVPEDFKRNVANHAMEIQQDNGLHRHLTFSAPGTCIDRFHLVTWPGYLCFCGDRGSYVFARVPDMFTFFRGDDGRINPGYWSEKCQSADRDGIKEFSEARFREVVEQYLNDHDASQELRGEVADEVLSELERGEHAAILAANDFHSGKFTFNEFWDHDLTEYTHRFLWCCHAIVWGIAMYDAARQAHPAPWPGDRWQESGAKETK
jgi:hypothetical protein